MCDFGTSSAGTEIAEVESHRRERKEQVPGPRWHTALALAVACHRWDLRLAHDSDGLEVSARSRARSSHHDRSHEPCPGDGDVQATPLLQTFQSELAARIGRHGPRAEDHHVREGQPFRHSDVDGCKTERVGVLLLTEDDDVLPTCDEPEHLIARKREDPEWFVRRWL